MAKGNTPVAADHSAPTIMVWDPVVRLFHWTTVTGVVLNLRVFEHEKDLHRVTGYVVVAALAIDNIRVLQVFAGSGRG